MVIRLFQMYVEKHLFLMDYNSNYQFQSHPNNNTWLENGDGNTFDTKYFAEGLH